MKHLIQEGNYLYTKGGELSLRGVNYIGEYHYNNYLPMTGPIPSEDTQVLQRFYSNSDHYTYDRARDFKVKINDFVDPRPIIYKPREQAYAAGFDTRYFVERVGIGNYTSEIDENQYNQLGKIGGIDVGLYSSSTIFWQLTGRLSEIKVFNEREILRASKNTPNIAYNIRNYTEYARITLV